MPTRMTADGERVLIPSSTTRSAPPTCTHLRLYHHNVCAIDHIKIKIGFIVNIMSLEGLLGFFREQVKYRLRFNLCNGNKQDISSQILLPAPPTSIWRTFITTIIIIKFRRQFMHAIHYIRVYYYFTTDLFRGTFVLLRH